MIFYFFFALWCLGFIVTFLKDRKEISEGIGNVSLSIKVLAWCITGILMFLLWWLSLFFSTSKK